MITLPWFRTAPLSAQFHARVRWALFPFPALLPHIPDQGTLVDLGCGHGLFLLYLANLKRSLQLVGVDPDEAKIAIGQRLVKEERFANVALRSGAAETLVLPPADAISLIDVLYLIPYDAQERLLRAAVSALSPSGKLLVKEMSERPRWKAAWNQAQELLSVRLLHLSVGDRFYFRTEAEWTALLSKLGLSVRRERLDRGYLHPHLLLIGQK